MLPIWRTRHRGILFPRDTVRSCSKIRFITVSVCIRQEALNFEVRQGNDTVTALPPNILPTEGRLYCVASLVIFRDAPEGRGEMSWNGSTINVSARSASHHKRFLIVIDQCLTKIAVSMPKPTKKKSRIQRSTTLQEESICKSGSYDHRAQTVA